MIRALSAPQSAPRRSSTGCCGAMAFRRHRSGPAASCCVAALFGLLVLENPILWYIDVGGAVINLLLLGYALPAVLALLLSYAVAGRRPVAYANTIAAGALILALAYVTFEIRRIYHGPVMTRGETTRLEQ